MALTITNLSKNTLIVSNKAKDTNDLTWDEALWTWNAAKGTWESPRIALSKSSKNSLSISNTNKN